MGPGAGEFKRLLQADAFAGNDGDGVKIRLQGVGRRGVADVEHRNGGGK